MTKLPLKQSKLKWDPERNKFMYEYFLGWTRKKSVEPFTKLRCGVGWLTSRNIKPCSLLRNHSFSSFSLLCFSWWSGCAWTWGESFGNPYFTWIPQYYFQELQWVHDPCISFKTLAKKMEFILELVSPYDYFLMQARSLYNPRRNWRSLQMANHNVRPWRDNFWFLEQ